MADYYPLLEKAVSQLKPPTRESRRAIYERARTAMLGHLRGMQPPMPESAIEREKQALEAAIARLERVFFYFPPVATPKSAVDRGLTGSPGSEFRAPAPPGKLTASADQLPHWMKSKAAKFLKRERTAKQLRADLASLGFPSMRHRKTPS